MQYIEEDLRKGFNSFREELKKSNERIVIQVVMGRAGSMLLQSLFDNHSQVVMYPGILNYFSEIAPAVQKNPENWRAIVLQSLDMWSRVMEPYNIHQNLGETGKENLPLDIKKISSIIDAIICDNTLDLKRLFLALHYAIPLSFGNDPENIRLIYLHEHQIFYPKEAIKLAKELFPNCKFVCITRDPRSNYLSIENWLHKIHQETISEWEEIRFRKNNFLQVMCWETYLHYMKLIEENYSFFTVVRLEDIQSKREEYIRLLANIFSLDFFPTMLKPTFGGLLWWGDNFSTRKPGFRDSASKDKWISQLSFIKQLAIEIMLKDEIKALHYKHIYKHFHFLIIFLWLYFPIMCLFDFKNIFFRHFYNVQKINSSKTRKDILIDKLKVYFYSVYRIVKFTFFVDRSYANTPNTLAGFKAVNK